MWMMCLGGLGGLGGLGELEVAVEDSEEVELMSEGEEVASYPIKVGKKKADKILSITCTINANYLFQH